MLKKVALSVTLLLVIGSWALAGCGSSEPPGLGDGPGMLYFYATWWPVCKAMTPIVDGLEETYGKDFEIVRVDIDTDQGKKLAREHNFIGQPTFIFFDDSGEEVRRLMGPQEAETMQREIDRILGR